MKRLVMGSMLITVAGLTAGPLGAQDRVASPAIAHVHSDSAAIMQAITNWDRGWQTRGLQPVTTLTTPTSPMPSASAALDATASVRCLHGCSPCRRSWRAWAILNTTISGS